MLFTFQILYKSVMMTQVLFNQLKGYSTEFNVYLCFYVQLYYLTNWSVLLIVRFLLFKKEGWLKFLVDDENNTFLETNKKIHDSICADGRHITYH